jgi:putative MFS transporter
LLQPVFGWRILWLINLPTGLTLVLLGGLIPESAKFLLARGRLQEAERVMQVFGSHAEPIPHAQAERVAGYGALTGARLAAKMTALSVCALAWGLINFGLLLWLPADLVAKGHSIGVSSRLLAESALIACPTVLVAALLYSRWSSKWSLITMIGVTLAGLALVLKLEVTGAASPVWPVALLIVGTNGIIAILLPYTAESVPLGVRARATGWIAACTKGGGLLAQALSISDMVPPMGIVAGGILIPAATSMILVAVFGRETRGRDLRELEVG